MDRTKSEFREDTSIHPYFRSKNTDYKYSGFDRGHIAAAGNHQSHQTLMDETFLLSNMAPQVGRGFNRDKWEHLERYVRKLTKGRVQLENLSYFNGVEFHHLEFITGGSIRF